MWYTVAKAEFGKTKVGTIFTVSKTADGVVLANRMKFSDDPKSFEMVVDPAYETISLTPAGARLRFISPSKDLAEIVEASIALSESAYC